MTDKTLYWLKVESSPKCSVVYHLEKVQYRILKPHQISKSKKKNIPIGPEITKLDFCGPDSHFGKVQYRILNLHQILSFRRKKLFKSVQKQRNYALSKNAKIVMFKWTFVVLTVMGKVQYRIWNPHQIYKSNKKKLLKSDKEQWNYTWIKKAKIVMFKVDVRTSRYCL